MILTEKKIKQKCQRRLRTLFPNFDSNSINFASTDYLNLATHPFVKEEAISYATKWGAGFLVERPLPSYKAALEKTERALAQFLGHESVTFYEPDPYLFSKLSSIDDKPLFSVSSIARKTGVLASIDDLVDMKKASKSLLTVDDSLSFSLLGNHGFGLFSEKEGVDILFGNFSKCFGSYISYFACSKRMKALLFEALPSLHKEQYIPPLFLGMINASLQLIPSMDAERKKLFHLKQLLFKTILKTGLHPTDTKAPFISLPFPNPIEQKNMQLHLADHLFIPGESPTALTFFPNLSLTEKTITSLFLILSSYKELPHFEAL